VLKATLAVLPPPRETPRFLISMSDFAAKFSSNLYALQFSDRVLEHIT
jgi:hypothetical protein